MDCLRVGVASLNQTPLDWDGNVARIRAALAEAKQQQLAVLCLPELAITGYGCEDAFLGLGTTERAWHTLLQLLPHTRDMAAVIGLPLMWRNACYNVAAVCVDGVLVALVAKQHLAGDGLHYEHRWFKPWPTGQRVNWHYAADGDDMSVPLGDVYCDIAGVRLGLEICEDAWVAQRPGARLAAQAIDIIMNPSASHFAFGKHVLRERIVCEGSRATGATYLYANLLGNEAGRVIYDGDGLIASDGVIIARAEPLTLVDWTLTSAVIDLTRARRRRAAQASFQPQVSDDSADGADSCVLVSKDLPRVAWQAAPDVALTPWLEGPHRKEESFARAVGLALVDYVRKSHSRGCVISLSGGADSAAVLALLYLVWQRGVMTFGLAAWCHRLGIATDAAFADWCTCVYQATAHSGTTTLHAARDVAHACGATFYDIDVEDLVQGYHQRVAAMLGRELSWHHDDIPLQNIQARARAPAVWMLANCLGALLLATSNRSEAAVGYATMDGDTCGGLSPIAGIDKAFLRQWLWWLERYGPQDLGPLPAMAAVNAQQPTAELRPAAAGQTDEEDLMPYPVLDGIERLAIRDKEPPATCLERLAGEFPDYPRDTLRQWVQRFFTLWCRNQWKRERYAPSFHLDDENLDPKTWCRFPILSGGFRQELAALV